MYVADVEIVPVFWKLRTQVEGPESCRAEPEDSFREYPAVEGIFRGKMPLVAFRPCFDRVRDMLSEQTVP